MFEVIVSLLVSGVTIGIIGRAFYVLGIKIGSEIERTKTNDEIFNAYERGYNDAYRIFSRRDLK